MDEKNAREEGQEQQEVAHEHERAYLAPQAGGHATSGVIVFLNVGLGCSGWGETLGEFCRWPKVDPPGTESTKKAGCWKT